MQLWLAMTVLYFAAGCMMHSAKYRRASSLQERRRMGALSAVAVPFGFIILQNIVVRNRSGWFVSTPPKLFSSVTFVAEVLIWSPQLIM
jgi:hypothetical protein